MTLSPTLQIDHCPLSHPPRPFPTSPSLFPCAAAGIVGCCCCFSARSSSPAPHHHHHLQRHHHHHHHHHQHRQHQHRRHCSHLLALCPSPPPSPHHHSFSEVLLRRVDRSHPRSPVDRSDLGSSQDWRDGRWPVSPRHSGCGDDLLPPPSSQKAVTAAAPLPPVSASSSSSKTWRWCRTLLVLPALLLLLLLPHRRKSRRYQQTRVPYLLLTLCLLTMLAGRCLASPWIEENANSVKLRAKVCQPVPEEHLRSILGTAYDPSRMSSQDPRNAGKRSDPSSAPEMEEASFDSYYMEDDPGAGEYVDEDFVDIVSENGEEQDWFRREEAVEEGGLEVEEKDFEAEERFYQKKRVGSLDSAQSDQPRSRSRGDGPTSDPDRLYLYMKRRRRATSSDRDLRSGGGAGSADRDKKNKDSLLPLRLLLSGRNRKLRRKLKKVFRKKAKKLGKKPPPWNCNMTKVWGRLKEGYFPRYLLDGRCATDKCFYRLYDCVPQKYRVKVLKRDPDYCNPLPALGANSTYEQKWSVVRYYVTVGCNCQAADPLQRSRSGRRRNS